MLVIRDRTTDAIIDANNLVMTGGMPTHELGLPSTPKVSQFEKNQGYTIEGMRFNMAGLWKLRVEFNVERNDAFFAESAEVLVAISHASSSSEKAPSTSQWTGAELQILNSLTLPLIQNNTDQTSKVSGNKLASLWGRDLFFDAELSRSGSTSCSTCHQPDRYFTDGLTLAAGQDPLTRNTPTLVGSRDQTWFYWDGRRDSLWSQALVPMEAAAEMNNTSTQITQTVKRKYQREYEAIFGSLPELPAANVDASPMGDDQQKQAWN